MADTLSNDEFAKAILADADAFQATIKAGQDRLNALAEDAFAKFQSSNEEMLKALTPASGQG